MSNEHACYTLVAKDVNASKNYNEKQIKADLEGTNISAKISALKEVIRCMANGERMNDLLMTVIRFVMPCQDHIIKKLLLLFWEIVPKYGNDGKLLHEMILVCDAYRKDLQHPNEYIRGCTLRFLCKLKEPELLEPLIPTIKQCLEHRHAYVRRNAVLAIFTIYKNFDFLFPDAPNMILQYLQDEKDSSCKRNAFIMLTHASQPMALEYLATCLDEVPDFDEILQLVIVELIYKVCHSNPAERARFIRCVYALLQSRSPSVRYEAAGTLVTLSNAPTAIKAVASCYIDLIMKESDNNVKLIVMDRLIALRATNERITQDLVMDIIQILSSSDLELRTKTLEFVQDLVTNRSVEELTSVLLKELLKACNTPASTSQTTKESPASSVNSDDARYRFSLVHTIYEMSMRFPNILPVVIPSLCRVLTFDEMGDSNATAEVCRFLREAIHRHRSFKTLILDQLNESFPYISGREALRHILWIFGQFSETKEEINHFMNLVKQSLGELPLVDNELKRLAVANGEQEQGVDAAGVDINANKTPEMKSAPKVTADGAYASQSAFVAKDKSSSAKEKVERPILQAALFDSDFLPGVILAVSLVKIFPRFQDLVRAEFGVSESSAQKENLFCAECMLFMATMINLAQSNLLEHHINPDLIDRIWKCFLMLKDRDETIMHDFVRISDEKLDQMLASVDTERRAAQQARRSGYNAKIQSQERERNRPDAPVKFNLLSAGSGRAGGDQLIDMLDMTLNQALSGIQLGPDGKPVGDAYATSKLSKVHQLTGFSDPVYAEAYVNVNQFDIVLDILIVNQTDDTLQNVNLEFSTLGDLKLVEQPAPITLAPADFTNIKANIKVSSTENGMIFGNIVYDVRGSSGESTCVVLNEIHIDILEYIMPATCTPTAYRQMWNEFEWENKVTVNTQIANLHLYLAHILQSTNFKCLTPKEAMAGECDYLCATMYAKSIFGEHVLANVCLEKQGPGHPVTGHVRIRAKTQGMAVTMGDKMSSCQKKAPSAELLKQFASADDIAETTATTQTRKPSQAITSLVDVSD